jgi:hypothetical protein
MKFLTIIILFISIQAEASVSKIVARHLRQKLNAIESAFSNQESRINTPLIHEGDDETAYYLKRIRLQYAPFVAFDIGIFEAKIIPIFEFRWTRKNPAGWRNYKR